MKAVVFDFAQQQFLFSEIPVPEPGDYEVLIQVEACGLNPVDAKIRQWQGMITSKPLYWIPGLDVAGSIAATGRRVTKWKIGDRVLCHGDMFRPFGGLAEYSIQAADTLLPHPDTAAEVAAATPCAGWTAWRALTDKLHVTAQDSILITGGAGGVGSFAIQLAKHFGLYPIITTCSEKNASFVKQLRADHFINYTKEDTPQRVAEITQGLGVTTGLDTVGGENDRILANSLAFEGRMVELVRTVRPEAYDQAFMRGLSFHQLSLGSGHRNGAAGKERMLAAGRRFSALLEQGAVSVPRLEKIPLPQVPKALNKMLEQHTVGKLVAVMV